jgi:hypothetical protein
MSRNHSKNMPSALEDVCIKLLIAAENDPALARLLRSKSSNHSRPLTHSSQSCHGFSGKYLAYVGSADGLTGVLLWPAVALHAILSILLGHARLATEAR